MVYSRGPHRCQPPGRKVYSRGPTPMSAPRKKGVQQRAHTDVSPQEERCTAEGPHRCQPPGRKVYNRGPHRCQPPGRKVYSRGPTPMSAPRKKGVQQRAHTDVSPQEERCTAEAHTDVSPQEERCTAEGPHRCQPPGGNTTTSLTEGAGAGGPPYSPLQGSWDGVFLQITHSPPNNQVIFAKLISPAGVQMYEQ
ncbi:hypothetical protein STEG23_003491 [Scotinomys teguina]